MRKTAVFLVEDDATLRKVLHKELSASGFDVTSFAAGEGVVAAVREHEPQVAVVDLRLPDISGLELLGRLLALDPDLQVVMLTGHGGVQEAVQAMRAGAYDFLQKPASLDVLEQTLQRAAEKRALLLENRRLRQLVAAEQGAPRLLGGSRAMTELRTLVQKVAATDENVLIVGESGTGKELVARAVHAGSLRRERPCVVVNCGAIAENLVESELFGHEKGAFTGAERRRPGLFEAADGGTLFLDEVGELPLELQPVLLRAIQFGEIRPVGGQSTKHVDVRVVAATNRDLVAAAAQGEFREDLYYRLATLVVRVPPLRDRREDVPEFARAFLEERKLGIEPAAMQMLGAYDWPGNVRELENVLRRLAVLATGATITAADVEQNLQATAARCAGPLPTLDLESLERMALVAALERHRWDKRAAATTLGVALKTLYNMIARYGVRP